MPADKSILFTRVGDSIDYGVAYAFGVLANLSYYPDQDFDNVWGQWFSFSETQTVTTTGNYVSNYTRVMSPGACVFGIAGTTHYLQMLDNILYSNQVHDLDFGSGYVHSFFRWVAKQLIPYIDADLAGRPTSTKLAFCGHSLGGAVAHLLAWYYSLQGYDVRNCVVFNSPKVGDPDFAELSRPFGYWHVVNAYDKVSGFPTWASFSINAGVAVLPGVTRWQHPEPMFEIKVPEASLVDLVVGASPARAAGILDWRFFWGSPLGPTMPTAAEVARVRAAHTAKAARFGMPLAAVAALGYLNIKNHEMGRLNAELLNLYRGSPGVLTLTDIIALQHHLDLNPDPLEDAAPYSRDVGLVDPVPFLTATPPAAPTDPIPASPPGTTIEDLAETGEAMAAAATPAGTGTLRQSAPPPVTNTTAPAFFDQPRPHYFYRGNDRRLLEKLAECARLIDARDLKTVASGPTTAISNREQVVDQFDLDLQQQWGQIQNRANFLLSLAYDD